MSNHALVSLIESQRELSLLRDHLQADHQYFYHGTPSGSVSSITNLGLDPMFEGSDSAYARKYETDKAIRFCTFHFPELARGAARTRASRWSDRLSVWEQVDSIVALRTPAISILNKNFGLDFSYGEMSAAAELILSHGNRLTADDCLKLIRQFGSISCYEPVAPVQLEICRDEVLWFSGLFLPLVPALP